MRIRSLLAALTLLAAVGRASAETPEEYRAKLTQTVADCTKAIERDPKDATAYFQRGAARFKLGQFAESVADFDRQLELMPAAGPGHWQRGIALYYAGKY